MGNRLWSQDEKKQGCWRIDGRAGNSERKKALVSSCCCKWEDFSATYNQTAEKAEYHLSRPRILNATDLRLMGYETKDPCTIIQDLIPLFSILILL
jgi:hypothetical protein